MRFARPIVGALALALGLLTEAVGYGWSEQLLWVPDLAVGLVWYAVGLRFWVVRPLESLLALAVGTTWFLASLVPVTVFWHRGLLVHLLLVLAFGNRGRVLIGTIGLVHLASLAPPVWQGEQSTIALASILLVTTSFGAAPGRTALSKAAQSCLVVTCLVLIVSAVTRLAAPDPGGAALPTLLAYEATLVVVGAVVAAVGASSQSDSVADRVLELNDGPASSLRDALADVLEDPTLGIGYWRDDVRGYTDLEDHPVVPPPPGSGRVHLHILDGDRPVALVLHDVTLRGDPRLAAAVGVATRLATANEDLSARVRERRAELAASRRRLVRTADEERADLASWLRFGPRARLTGLLTTLRALHDGPPHLNTAAENLAGTLEDLDRWERGLHPRDLERGLRPALETLAATSPIPVTVAVRGPRVPPAVEAAIYYVCMEALANVSKHAEASRASVVVSSHADLVTLEVLDDGVGGASVDDGTGLKGARDRLETIGGTLTVTSGPGGTGTRLSGAAPLSRLPVRTDPAAEHDGDSSADPGERTASEDRV